MLVNSRAVLASSFWRCRRCIGQSHDDIGAKFHFRVDGDFRRRKLVEPSRWERNSTPSGPDFGEATLLFSERPNLETAAVGKNRFIPVHEGVKSAHFGDNVASGAEERW